VIEPYSVGPTPIFGRLSNDELWSKYGVEFVKLSNYSPETLKKSASIYRSFRAFSGDIPVHEVTPEILAEFVTSIDGGKRSPRTVDWYMAVLSAWFTWLRKRKHIADNPFESFHRSPSEPPPPRPYRVNEVLTIAENCRGDKQAPRDKALVLLILYTGGRISEALNLTLNDVDALRGWVQFRNTKGRRPRKVPIPGPLARQLETYLPWRKLMYPQSEWLFPNQRGERLLPPAALASIQAYNDPSFRFHRIRHTYVTETIRRTNGNIALAQKLAGHQDPKTTIRYAEISDQDLKAVAKVWDEPEVEKFDKRGRRVRRRRFFR